MNRMAIKNRIDELSGFGLRLMGLMKINGNDSTPKLAAALYDAKLITPKSTKNLEESESYQRVDAIESIKKMITKHLHSESEKNVQGEYIIAYCTLFNCSTDYLLGFTDVKSRDIDVRQICEKTGLSENAVLRLVNDTDSEIPIEYYRECWSSLMESDLFDSLPGDFISADREYIDSKCLDGKIRSRLWILDNQNIDQITALMLDSQIQTLQNSNRRRKSAFYGMLAKITRDISNVYEGVVASRCSHLEEQTFFEEKQVLLEYAKVGNENDNEKPFLWHVTSDV